MTMISDRWGRRVACGRIIQRDEFKEAANAVLEDQKGAAGAQMKNLLNVVDYESPLFDAERRPGEGEAGGGGSVDSVAVFGR